MNERHFLTDKVSDRMYHGSEADVLVTYASKRAMNGPRADVEELIQLTRSLVKDVRVTYWRNENVDDYTRGFLVKFPFNSIFVMYFKAMLLPGERGWLQNKKVWFVRDNGEAALLRLCRVLGVPCDFQEAQP